MRRHFLVVALGATFASLPSPALPLAAIDGAAPRYMPRILRIAVMGSGYGHTTRCRRSSNCASVWPNASRKLTAGSSRSANSAK